MTRPQVENAGPARLPPRRDHGDARRIRRVGGGTGPEPLRRPAPAARPGPCLLEEPPILILDEGTSALDNISERLVQQAITAARVDRTVILVAHRLTTLRDANRILVFKDGQIAETAAYNELVCRGGVFTELVQSASEESAPNASLELLFEHSESLKKIA